MEFLKKHYEKVILSVVLLGMAVAAAFLPLKVSQVREDLAQTTRSYDKPKIKPLPELDMATNRAVLSRVKSPEKTTLTAPGHNLFNPIEWKKKADGTPVPSEQFGVGALQILAINPLFTKIEYRGARDSGGQTRYDFMVTREAATNVTARSPMPRTVALGGKTDVFVLRDAKDPKEAATEVVLDLIESKETVTLSKGKPYTEVAGYCVDLRYEAENRPIPPRLREGQKVAVGGNNYIIVAITEREVILEDSRTKKRTTITVKAGQ